MASPKIDEILLRNIDEFTKARGLTHKYVAQYVGVRAHGKPFTESWISKKFRAGHGIPVKYFPHLADLFGIEPYHLLIPGVAGTLERRSGFDRRTRGERRQDPGVRLAQLDDRRLYRQTEGAYAPITPVGRRGIHPQVQRVMEDAARKASQLLAQESRRQTPTPLQHQPKPPRSRRDSR